MKLLVRFMMTHRNSALTFRMPKVLLVVSVYFYIYQWNHFNSSKGLQLLKPLQFLISFGNMRRSILNLFLENPSLTFAPPSTIVNGMPNSACDEGNTDTGLFLPSGTCQAKAYICLRTGSGKTLLELVRILYKYKKYLMYTIKYL